MRTGNSSLKKPSISFIILRHTYLTWGLGMKAALCLHQLRFPTSSTTRVTWSDLTFCYSTGWTLLGLFLIILSVASTQLTPCCGNSSDSRKRRWCGYYYKHYQTWSDLPIRMSSGTILHSLLLILTQMALKQGFQTWQISSKSVPRPG